jgi:hypothetical protein
LGSDWVVIVMLGLVRTLRVMMRDAEASPELSVAMKAGESVWMVVAAVGVPCRSPVVSRINPAGRLPEAKDQV